MVPFRRTRRISLRIVAINDVGRLRSDRLQKLHEAPCEPIDQLEVAQSTGHLMTPPMSPAILNRGSVINQGPMAIRPSSVASVLPTHPQVSSFSEPLFQNLPPPNQNYFGTSSNYQAMFRAHVQPPSGTFHHRVDQNRYTQLNDQQIQRDYYPSSCTMSPYSVHPSSNYGSASNAQETQSMQFLNGGFNFINGSVPGSCQGGTYSSNTANGYYGNNLCYQDSHRIGSMVDQHVSVISSVSSIRPLHSFNDIHDPLNILDDSGRKLDSYYTDSSPPMICRNSMSSNMENVISPSSSQCMYGSTDHYTSQETMDSHGHTDDVREMESSLPPINTVFLGATSSSS
ncbi:DNA-binding RFX6 [Pelobates cultripes]|uniref:DNA-binding RFX6 n=1 Tax=Pelobates cultripes TaxID=61616 RepID=A0AAD1VUB7_PELCU|nr:DNA-binding RFX6 [Pelobates cultripes]